MAEPDETSTLTPSGYDDARQVDEEVEEEEEVIEEEYYEEEAVEDDDDYDDEEFFEEFVEDSDEETGESAHEGTQASSQAFDDSTAPPPSVTDSTPSDYSRPMHPDPEGITQFADSPPPKEDSESDQPTDYADFGSTDIASQFDDAPTTTVDAETTIAVADEENQQSLQFTTPNEEPPPVVPVPSRVAPEVEKDSTKTSPFWYWVIFALVCALLGGGAYAGWYLVNEDRKDAPDLGEEQTQAPTPSPTVGLTTAFDPIQGNCDFAELKNPHVIDQCICVGEIQIVADDVRTRYESRKANFIPTLYEVYDDVITDCTPRNQALVWISSGNDFEFTYSERVERFALATTYASLGGNDWENNGNWFNEDSICTWEGVTCDQDGMVQILALSDNQLNGSVSVSK